MKAVTRKHAVIWVAVLALAVLFAVPTSAQGFEQGIVVEFNGQEYYVAGPPLGPNGERDVPGHYWVQAGPNQLVGKHYNDGKFWSSDAPEGELLFIVHGIIDTWSPEKALDYYERGYVHYHELFSIDDQAESDEWFIWLKHTARTTFTLDSGPATGKDFPITPGVAYNFLPNWDREPSEH